MSDGRATSNRVLLYALSVVWLVVGVLLFVAGHIGWMIVAFAVSAALWLIAADAMERLP